MTEDRFYATYWLIDQITGQVFEVSELARIERFENLPTVVREDIRNGEYDG